MPLLVLAVLLFVTNPAQTPEPDALARGRAALAALTARQFASIEARFTDEMKAAMPPGRLEFTWTMLLAQAGAHKSCAPDSRVVAIADKQMVITACEFERAQVDVQFAFDTQGRIAGMRLRPPATAPAPVAPYSPPAYADPAAYNEQEVKIGTADWPLPATLTMPAGDKSYPAVVLVHGSGPNDRDETVGGNKPFKDLAVGLASRGIAVLRYDKRSKVHGPRLAALTSLTVKEEVLDDVSEALAWVSAHPSIDPRRIFVLGHSLGGMLVPRIVSANGTVAGAIVLAGAARPIEVALVEQSRYIAMLDGTISPEEQQQIDVMEKASAAIKGLGARDASGGGLIAGAPPSYWLDLRGYDAPTAAPRLTTRLLVLQGERDYQVTMAEFERWKRALGGRREVTFRSYPALNHLFIAGTGRSTPQEYLQPSHVAEEVIRDIAAWIRPQ